MTEKQPRVLLAGIGRGPFEAIAPVLDRQKIRIEQVASPEDAVELACSSFYDLIIVDAQLDEMGLDEIVDILRAEPSASRKCSLLVIAEPGMGKGASDLIGNGINRVMHLDDPQELIEQQVADLLEVSPRAAVRFAARLYTSLDDGIEEVFGQTTNVSITGMLVQTPTLLEPGQPIVFEIVSDDSEVKVTGEAHIVRHALPDRDGVTGVGVRFLNFTNQGREILGSVLEDALADLLDNDFDA